MFMNIAKKQISKKKIIIIVLAVLLVGGGLLAAFLLNRQNSQSTPATRGMNDVDYSPSTPADNKDTDQRKQGTVPATTPAEKPNDQPSQQKPVSDSINVAITIASQGASSGTNGKGQPVNIRTVVSGTKTGTCDVSLTKSGQTTITKVFTIKFEATTASCNGDILAAEFGADGDWQLSVTAKSDALTSRPATATVSVKR
jgi:hypothetical protein